MLADWRAQCRAAEDQVECKMYQPVPFDKDCESGSAVSVIPASGAALVAGAIAALASLIV